MKKREAGFSLLEVLVAASVMLIIVGATVRGLTDAVHATQAVTLMADTQDNLRGAMNYMVRDLMQAGTGITQGGITIPNTGVASALGRPGPAPGNFPAAWTVLPAIAPGFQAGLPTLTPNPANLNLTIAGTNTDTVNVLYSDNTLIDANRNWLNKYPIRTAAGAGGPGCAVANPTPSPAGTIITAGATTTITFDISCINISAGNTGLNPGDLILLQANTGCVDTTSVSSSSSCDAAVPGGSMALLSVSNVNGAANSINFICGDAYGLNCSGMPTGTITQIQSPAGSYANVTVTATRLWMVSYFVSNINPFRPQLMRQVNFNPAQAVGDVIENMQVFYDILNPGTNPPSLVVPPQQENPTLAQLQYIRDAHILLCSRSENPYGPNHRYFRNNLQASVSVRGLDFYNQFQ